MTRKVFYSFHFELDSWRAAQVRNMGVIEGNEPAQDNDWEEVKRGGDEAIKTWIANQMEGRTCTVVLVGEKTANRKWINHEIIESWKNNMGVVGIHIHGLENDKGETSCKGQNPFDFIYFESGKKMSEIVKCYDPQGNTSKDRYKWISIHLANAVEEAIGLRKRH